MGRSTRQRPNGDYEVPEREYRTMPRQATPSFLRESVNVPAGLSEDMKMCYKSLKRLMNHKWAGPFLQPVDPVAMGIPDYPDIVKNSAEHRESRAADTRGLCVVGASCLLERAAVQQAAGRCVAARAVAEA